MMRLHALGVVLLLCTHWGGGQDTIRFSYLQNVKKSTYRGKSAYRDGWVRIGLKSERDKWTARWSANCPDLSYGHCTGNVM